MKKKCMLDHVSGMTTFGLSNFVVFLVASGFATIKDGSEWVDLVAPA